MSVRGQGGILLYGALVCALGCGDSSTGDEQPAEEPEAENAAQAEVASDETTETSGSPLGDAFIEGQVRLDEGYAEAPLYTMEDIGMTPANSERPEGCPPVRRSDRRPLSLAEDRGLGGVLVSISREEPFEREPPGEPQRRVVSIEECMLTPALMVARRGDSLVIRNETDQMFMPRVVNDPFMQGLLPNQERVIPLEAAGRVVDIQCQISTGCGRSDVVVLGHPYFAVTDADGRFRIEGLPAGTYQVHAWHPLVPEAATTVEATNQPSSEALVLTVRSRERPAGPSTTPEEARRVEGASSDVSSASSMGEAAAE